jgi:hypothetical protein
MTEKDLKLKEMKEEDELKLENEDEHELSGIIGNVNAESFVPEHIERRKKVRMTKKRLALTENIDYKLWTPQLLSDAKERDKATTYYERISMTETSSIKIAQVANKLNLCCDHLLEEITGYQKIHDCLMYEVRFKGLNPVQYSVEAFGNKDWVLNIQEFLYVKNFDNKELEDFRKNEMLRWFTKYGNQFHDLKIKDFTTNDGIKFKRKNQKKSIEIGDQDKDKDIIRAENIVKRYIGYEQPGFFEFFDEETKKRAYVFVDEIGKYFPESDLKDFSEYQTSKKKITLETISSKRRHTSTVAKNKSVKKETRLSRIHNDNCFLFALRNIMGNIPIYKNFKVFKGKPIEVQIEKANEMIKDSKKKIIIYDKTYSTLLSLTKTITRETLAVFMISLGLHCEVIKVNNASNFVQKEVEYEKNEKKWFLLYEVVAENCDKAMLGNKRSK